MSNFDSGLICIAFLMLSASTQVFGNQEETTSENLDLIFLLDGSGSVEYMNFELVKSWVIEMSNFFDLSSGKTHIGVIQYSYAISNRPPYIGTEIPLGPHRNQNQFRALVSAISLQGLSTYTAHALLKSIIDFKSSSRFNDTSTRKVLILVTDGAANDFHSLPSAVEQVRDAGITTYVVGVSDRVDKEELKFIAGNDTDKVVTVTSFFSLSRITNELSASIGQRRENFDLIFLLDESGSIAQENFKSMKNWIIQISDILDLSDGTIHIGVIQYSQAFLSRRLDDQTFLKTEIPLGPHQNQNQFNESVSAIRQQRPSTYTAQALLESIIHFKSSGRFNDTSTRKVLVLLTDGAATDHDRLFYAAEQVRNARIMTFAVGVGDEVNREELELITGDGGYAGKVFEVEDFDSLSSIANDLSIGIRRSVRFMK